MPWPARFKVIADVFGLGLFGVTLWALGEAVSSTVTHSFYRRYDARSQTKRSHVQFSQAVERVQANQELNDLIGQPVQPGHRFKDSIVFTHGGYIASCEIAFDGTKRSSDVIVRV